LNDAPDPEFELAHVEVRLEQALAERDLARQGRRRLEEEVRRLEQELAHAKLDLAAVRERIAERETYVRNLHSSRGWKALQAVRGLFGRRW
jgi:predicted  nucleic acid-binding Zn-ribbon protein